MASGEFGVPHLTLKDSNENLLVRRRVTNGVAYLTLNDSLEVRTFQYSQTFYSIYQHRRRQIVFGERPKELCEVETIDQRVWEQHQVHLKRLDNFPLKKAEFYKNLQQSTGIKSVRALSEITGEDWSYIARILKTLTLPEAIQNVLKENQQSEVVKQFHLRKLLELARLPSSEAQLDRFREMMNRNISSV